MNGKYDSIIQHIETIAANQGDDLVGITFLRSRVQQLIEALRKANSYDNLLDRHEKLCARMEKLIGHDPRLPDRHGESRIPEAEFRVGDKVRKVTGDYQIDGIVRSVFPTGSRLVRYVVEHKAEGGGSFLHIYSGSNLKKIEDKPDPCEKWPDIGEAVYVSFPIKVETSDEVMVPGIVVGFDSMGRRSVEYEDGSRHTVDSRRLRFRFPRQGK